MVIAVHGSHPVQIKDVARIERGPAPVFTVVTAQGRDAVLLNVQSQPDGSTLDIANALKTQLQQLRQELPPDMHLGFFYDQSQFVRDSVGSVWDAIIFGLILSVLILFFFLKNWGSVWTAIVTIPITVLITFVAMKLAGMSFNMMTLGGIAASIGLIIDDAIVVVEAMCVKIAAGRPKLEGIQEAIGEILHPLIGSTLTPVVVFHSAGIFDRHHGRVFPRAGVDDGGVAAHVAGAGADADAVAGRVVHPRPRKTRSRPAPDESGWRISADARPPHLRTRAARGAAISLAHVAGLRRWFSCRRFSFTGSCSPIFCPSFDEGGFVIDYWAPPGTSLTETSRQLNEAEEILSRESRRGRLFAPARHGNGHVHHRTVSRRFRGQTQAATASTRPMRSSPNCATLSTNNSRRFAGNFPASSPT